MSAVVHSINISTQGGVPKLPIDKAEIKFEGVEGDFNKFRSSKMDGDLDRAISLFSIEMDPLMSQRGCQKAGSPATHLKE